jgi:cell division protein FtsB
MKTALELFKYAFNSENPALSYIALVVAITVCFAVFRRFFTTDYIAQNKESREQLKQLNDVQAHEIERLNCRVHELEADIEKLKNDNPGHN